MTIRNETREWGEYVCHGVESRRSKAGKPFTMATVELVGLCTFKAFVRVSDEGRCDGLEPCGGRDVVFAAAVAFDARHAVNEWLDAHR